LGFVECKFHCTPYAMKWAELIPYEQGLLLAGILSGGSTSETFSPDAQLNRTKAYMVFILAFMAITSIIVRLFCIATTLI